MTHERLLDLLYDDMTGNISEIERAELGRLLVTQDDADSLEHSMERTISAVDLAYTTDVTPLPDHLHQKLVSDAQGFFEAAIQADDQNVIALPQGKPERSNLWLWTGWLAAAALLVFFLVPTMSPSEQLETAAEARTRLLSQFPNLKPLDLSATDDSTATGANGDVVWSAEAQQGFMRISGLQPNDPSRFQYQLWIFDANRDDRYPVDGGVFDIGGPGEQIVPIQATLAVNQVALFAITVEPPGGVVVSSRERIALVAKP